MKPRLHSLTHDHIDGNAALAYDIEDLYRMVKKPFPFPSVDALRAFFKDPHVNIVDKFATVTSVLQSKEALELVIDSYVTERAIEGYSVIESKLAPQYHTAGGLRLKEVVSIMCNALWRAGNHYDVRVVPHVCIGREAPPEVGVEIAKIVMGYNGDVVLDLACDEAGHPPWKHLPAFSSTFGTNVRRECHAGEWVAEHPHDTYRQRLMQNLRSAIFELRCHGVSHAIPLIDDPELIRVVVDKGIRISGCPLSNLTCGSIKDVRELGIDRLLEAGVQYTLNADDDLFLPPMTEVLDVCDAAYAFTEAQCAKLESISKSAPFLQWKPKA